MTMYKFRLNEIVKIDVSGEEGAVIARAEYEYANPSYLIRYKRADGVATESWWTEESLTNSESV